MHFYRLVQFKFAPEIDLDQLKQGNATFTYKGVDFVSTQEDT